MPNLLINAPQTQPKATGLIKFCNRKTDVGNALYDLRLNQAKYYISISSVYMHGMHGNKAKSIYILNV